MAYSYKCNISFGLVYIPVKLVVAAKSNDIGFNMIDGKSHSRIKYQKVDESGNSVNNSDIVRGYEYEDGKYVVFTDDDLDKIKTPSDKNIEIQCFVPEREIEPVYYNKPYYVVPSGAEKAFNVLVEAMRQTGMAAIAKTVLGSKETLIAIRSLGGSAMLSTLFFYDEIQVNPYKCSGDAGEKELALAKAIINGMEERFSPEKYRDEYRDRLLSAIKAKADGKEFAVPSGKSERNIGDLMEALQRSLDEKVLKKQAVSKAKSNLSSKKRQETDKAKKTS